MEFFVKQARVMGSSVAAPSYPYLEERFYVLCVRLQLSGCQGPVTTLNMLLLDLASVKI